MYCYPELSPEQQSQLPPLTAPAIGMAAQFSDSTHQLWHCETVAGPMILKVCHQQRIEQSAFWQGMNTLFAINFPASLDTISITSAYLARRGGLLIPEVIASQPNRFVLTRFLPGRDVTLDSVTETIVVQLAQHLGKLHQHQSANWGSVPAPSLPAEVWPQQLAQTLKLLADTALAIDDTVMEQAIQQALSIQVKGFVVMMPDLRWDQLRQTETGQLAVVDLDAFVCGPAELEWVLLEYLLTRSQARLFAEVYQQYQALPDLGQCRYSYRILLFLMQVLGETDLQRWLRQPTLF